MRQFKFRAWDERNEVMHYDFQFIKSGDSGNDWIVFISDKSGVKSGHSKDEHQIVLDNPYFRQQLKVMQYTGLKDKNGKDIYEGDVISFVAASGYADGIGLVKWNCNMCGFILVNHADDIYDSIYDFTESILTIMGNVYNNPELVEGRLRNNYENHELLEADK